MSTTVNFRIEEKQKAQLKLLAELEDIKISKLLRNVITEYLDQYEFSNSQESFGLDEHEDSNNDDQTDALLRTTHKEIIVSFLAPNPKNPHIIYLDPHSDTNDNYSL